METRRASAYFARGTSRRWSSQRWSAKAAARSSPKDHDDEAAFRDEENGGAANAGVDDVVEPPMWGPGSTPPETAANPISKVLFNWVKPMFSRASELHKKGRALEQDDLLPLPALDHADVVGVDFEDGWKRDVSRTKNKTASAAGAKKRKKQEEKLASGEWTTRQVEARANAGHLQKALLAVMGRRFAVAGFVKLFNTCLQFSFPLILNAVLAFIEQSQFGDGVPESDKNRGYWLSALLFAAMALKAATENVYFHMVYRCGYQSRVAVSTAVYSKSLRLASAERRGTTLGELVNLMQVDATKIEMFVPQIHVLWDGMLQIVGYMTILFTLIGWPCLVGLAVMFVAGPVQGKIMGRLFGMNRKMVKHTDGRVKTTNEALQGVRCVKMYTWESSFDRAISASRNEELTFLEKLAYLRGFSRAYMGALPGVVAVASFVAFAYGTGRPVEASTLFAALVAFDQLRFPLLFYPMALAQLAQAKVSAGRVASFLGMAEVHAMGGRYVRDDPDGGRTTGGGEIIAEGATVYWSDPKVPVAAQKEGEALDAAGSLSSSKKARRRSSNASTDSTGKTTDRRRSSLNKSNRSDRSINTADVEEGDSVEEVLPSAVLTDVSLRVKPGELCTVVGRVGSGKSTLCSAILNETVLGDGSEDGESTHGSKGGGGGAGGGGGGGGKITVRGSVAYASQSAWILNGTVRDNILFGRPMDRARYDAVLSACQLSHDLTMLDDGDLTEIGERGINLSGGQKQRISVARAAYSDADVIVLDDPLSALDPEVAGRLFEECVVKFLSGKTRLLVTNQLQCLKSCDAVVALGGGRILEQGTYEELDAKEGGEVQRLLRELRESAKKEESERKENEGGGGGDEGDASAEKGGASPAKDASSANKGGDSAASETETTNKPSEEKKAKALTATEERNVGAVKLSVYRKYIRAGGGYLRFAFVYFSFILCAAVGLMNNVWVSIWTSDANYERRSMGFYLGLYAFTAITLGFVTFLRSYLLAKFGVRASKKLHEDILASVLRAPMSFFDTTPTGRILSRFSKDMHSIDQELSEYFDFFLLCSLSVIVSFGTITFVTPWFGVAVVPILIVYVVVLNYFREVARETKRLDSISRSPVYAHFSETLGGLATIRAYGASERFVAEFVEKLDGNTRTYYCNKSADRWLSVRLEMIGALVAGLAAVFSSSMVVSGTAGSNFASLAGLSLTSAISVTGLLNWCVRSFAQLEAGMNSSERVLHYTENIPQEAPATSAELEKRAATVVASVSSEGADDAAKEDPSAFAVRSSGGKALYPDADWPSNGAIELNDLHMRYRSGTPLVLKGLNVSISGGERIGVVGRTGSGKSSLLLNLMRIVEPDLTPRSDDDAAVSSYSPPIVIDGVDVLRVGLDDLRSKLGIIPQNPVLFSGTIRSNLDPFDEYEDKELWSALDGCGMRAAVEAMPDGLSGTVAEYGDNLSQGQRQLLCLGRALLRKCRVLLLDEATSSVDFETDREIQRTLREAFKGSTIITIAHRVNTIMDSDKILVMKDGKVAEFAPPKELLSDERSFFSEIVRHAEAEHH